MIVDCAVYEHGCRKPGELPVGDAWQASRPDDAFVWIGMHEPSEEEFDSVRREFELHDLAVEDAIVAHQRPKLEVYGDSLFVVLKPARWVEAEEVVEYGEVLIFLGEGQVLELHAAVAPLAEPLDRLASGRHELIHAEMRPYLRDVHDHLLRVLQVVDNDRDLLTSVLAANLTQIGVRQNEDMRRISAWAAIVAAPTLIVGVYGMNFRDMPELRWRLGYPLALALILVVCLTLFRYFRRIDWL